MCFDVRSDRAVMFAQSQSLLFVHHQLQDRLGSVRNIGMGHRGHASYLVIGNHHGV